MSDPMITTEVAVEQRIVSLMSAADSLKKMSAKADSRAVIARPKCMDYIETVRDALSEILDKVESK